MLSMAQEYALRAAIFLAQHEGHGPVGHQEISVGTKVPAAYLSKILQNLAKTEVLTSKRGVSGGFELARKPADISLLDVIDAVEPFKCLDSCPLNLESHKHTFCPVHARLRDAQNSVRETLAASTLAELLSESGRPIPLVESGLQP